jgi:hypothetical protein
VVFAYNEVVQGGGTGRGGQMTMPATVKLALMPFDGGQVFPVTARMRWRLESGGKLALWYDLLRLEDILDMAFEDERQVIKNGTVGSVRAVLARAGVTCRAVTTSGNGVADDRGMVAECRAAGPADDSAARARTARHNVSALPVSGPQRQPQPPIVVEVSSVRHQRVDGE